MRAWSLTACDSSDIFKQNTPQKNLFLFPKKWIGWDGYSQAIWRLAAEKIADLVEKIPFVGGRFRNWLETKLFDALMTQFPSAEEIASSLRGTTFKDA